MCNAGYFPSLVTKNKRRVKDLQQNQLTIGEGPWQFHVGMCAWSIRPPESQFLVRRWHPRKIIPQSQAQMLPNGRRLKHRKNLGPNDSLGGFFI